MNSGKMILIFASVALSLFSISNWETSTGSVVTDRSELDRITGAACVGQSTLAHWVCYGSAGQTESDCSGCGCTRDHFIVGTGVYGTTLANCSNDPHCTTVFPRGSCSGS